MSGSLFSLALPAALGIGSALIGGSANRSAANTQAQATQQAADQSRQANLDSLAYLRESRDMGRGDLAPYRDAGLADYGTLRGQVGTQFQESPGYRFALQEGLQAIDRGASARGLLNSGARVREATRYGTGMASQEYGNWLSRLQALAGVGQTATGQSASLAANAGAQGAGIINQGGAQQAGLTMAGGQAQAAGTVNQANTTLGGVNQGLGLWALMNPGGFGNVRAGS